MCNIIQLIYIIEELFKGMLIYEEEKGQIERKKKTDF